MGPARQLHPADVERPMKSSLDWSNFNNYQQTTKSKSEAVQEQEKISLFRSIVGSGIYLRQERYDVAFSVKELASRMSNPTAMSFHHLKKFLGILKKAMDYCLVLEFSTSRRRLYQERRKRLVLGDILRFRPEWKQNPQTVNIRRISCVE